MQLRKTGSSHKRNSCSYHDITLAKEGSMIKTMTQVGPNEMIKKTFSIYDQFINIILQWYCKNPNSNTTKENVVRLICNVGEFIHFTCFIEEKPGNLLVGGLLPPPSIGKRPIYFRFFLLKASFLAFLSSSKKRLA